MSERSDIEWTDATWNPMPSLTHAEYPGRAEARRRLAVLQ